MLIVLHRIEYAPWLRQNISEDSLSKIPNILAQAATLENGQFLKIQGQRGTILIRPIVNITDNLEKKYYRFVAGYDRANYRESFEAFEQKIQSLFLSNSAARQVIPDMMDEIIEGTFLNHNLLRAVFSLGDIIGVETQASNEFEAASAALYAVPPDDIVPVRGPSVSPLTPPLTPLSPPVLIGAGKRNEGSFDLGTPSPKQQELFVSENASSVQGIFEQIGRMLKNSASELPEDIFCYKGVKFKLSKGSDREHLSVEQDLARGYRHLGFISITDFDQLTLEHASPKIEALLNEYVQPVLDESRHLQTAAEKRRSRSRP